MLVLDKLFFKFWMVKKSLKYCMQCVNQNLKINYMNNGFSLCRLCEQDKDTDKELSQSLKSIIFNDNTFNFFINIFYIFFVNKY